MPPVTEAKFENLKGEISDTFETEQDLDSEVEEHQAQVDELDAKAIVDAYHEMEKIDEKRDQLNADAKVIMSGLKQRGIPAAAFKAAYKRYKMNPEKREQMDQGIKKCFDAMNTQSDLFDNE